MYAFLCNLIPRSINAKRKQKYFSGLACSFRKYNPTVSPLKKKLYGFVYYFHRLKTGLDADNLSKPVWDALQNIAYIDDRQISFRSSGIIDLQQDGINEIDTSCMPNIIFQDFLKMIDNNVEHILYVEIGEFSNKLIKFGFNK